MPEFVRQLPSSVLCSPGPRERRHRDRPLPPELPPATSTSTRTTSTSTPIRTRRSDGSGKNRRCTTTPSTTSTRSAASRMSNKALVDHETFSSARGAIIELIKANIDIPPGTVIFEDPPIHDIHRKLLARMFTPRKINALEPKIRDYCAQSLDPLIGTDRFDFVADLGAQMPMKVISALLGIPEDDQEMIRDHANAQMRTEAGKPMKRPRRLRHRRDLRGLHRLARRPPVGRHHDRTAQRGVRRRDGYHASPDPPGTADLSQRGGGRGQRNHHAADRLGGQGVGRTPRPAPRTRREPGTDSPGDRGIAALRAARTARRPVRDPRRRDTTARRCPRAA